MDLSIYKDEADEWRWRLTADNGETVADSGEGYTERNDALEAADRVATAFKEGVELDS